MHHRTFLGFPHNHVSTLMHCHSPPTSWKSHIMTCKHSRKTHTHLIGQLPTRSHVCISHIVFIAHRHRKCVRAQLLSLPFDLGFFNYVADSLWMRVSVYCSICVHMPTHFHMACMRRSDNTATNCSTFDVRRSRCRRIRIVPGMRTEEAQLTDNVPGCDKQL